MNSEKVMSEPQRRAMLRMAMSETPLMGAKATTGLGKFFQEKLISHYSLPSKPDRNKAVIG